MSSRSVPGGAASKAAATRAVGRECAALAATSRQRRLCATSTIGMAVAAVGKRLSLTVLKFYRGKEAT